MIADRMQRRTWELTSDPQVSEDIEPDMVFWNFRAYKVIPPCSATPSNPSQKVRQMGIKWSNIWTCEVHFHSSCHKGWQTILKDNINPLLSCKDPGKPVQCEYVWTLWEIMTLIFEEIWQFRLEYYSKNSDSCEVCSRSIECSTILMVFSLFLLSGKIYFEHAKNQPQR